MKQKRVTLFIVWFALAFMASWTSHAQHNQGFEHYKADFWKRWKVGLGWSFIENDGKPLYILDGFSGWRGPLLPKTLTMEYRFDPSIRLQLGIASTRFQPKGEEGVSGYFSMDANVLYNFRAFRHYSWLRDTWTLRNLHKERFYFDSYFLGGIGYNPIATPSFNTGLGTDYWFHYRWGVNLQTMAKWTLDADNRFHMHHSMGVVYRIDQGNDAGALNTLRNNQNRKRKRNKAPKAVIPEKRTPQQQQQDEDFEDFTD